MSRRMMGQESPQSRALSVVSELPQLEKRFVELVLQQRWTHVELADGGVDETDAKY